MENGTMAPMQDTIDSGVCIHHDAMCKQATETNAIVKEIRDKLLGTMDKKGMITEHCEMYDSFIASLNNKKSILQHSITYIISATLGGLIVLIGMGIKAAL